MKGKNLQKRKEKLMQNGDVLQYNLSAESVFEELTPRLYDIDGDGDDEIFLVRSNLYDGAAVSVLTVGATGLEVFGEAYPIGLAHLWISPLDAPDFDGEGVMEVAAMVAPHLQGLPSFYNRERQRLKQFAAAPGFSTHYIDSSILGMSVILDAHSDGRPGIVLPSLDRETLYTVGLEDPGKLESSKPCIMTVES